MIRGIPPPVAFIVFAKRTQDATAGGPLGRACCGSRRELFEFKEVIHEITDRLAAFMHYT